MMTSSISISSMTTSQVSRALETLLEMGMWILKETSRKQLGSEV